MRKGRVWLAGVLTLTAPACLKKDPLYCDENTPCMDPERPFCDLNGEFPASEGIKRTCIADPFDGGSPDAGAERRVVDLFLGPEKTCALIDDGAVRCWGKEALGYSDGVAPVGDDEHPYTAGDVPTGGPIKEMALAASFSCFLYEAGNVRCVGDNQTGRLGYGHTDPVPATPADGNDVPLGEAVRHISAGYTHVCAILESGAVRCWGQNVDGALGYGDLEITVGDDEVPAELDALDIGGAATALTAGLQFSCAILGGGDGRLRCWGMSVTGQLGYGNTNTIGDNEAAGSGGDVMVGVREVVSVGGSSCALFEDNGAVKCWGDGNDILGYGNLNTIGDNEEARLATNVSVGGVVAHLGGGPKCALMTDDTLRCWGTNEDGELGTGDREAIGDNETPADSSGVILDGPVSKVARGLSGSHMCALMTTGAVRCWGKNSSGELGLGHQENIGDNELPTAADPVRVLE